jgi:hypothetical protein
LKAPVRQTLQSLDHAAEMERRVERLDLLHQLVDQPLAGNHRKAWDVVDRLFRVEFGALAARLVEYVDQRGIEIEETELEHCKKPDRAGADDYDVLFDRSGCVRHAHRHVVHIVRPNIRFAAAGDTYPFGPRLQSKNVPPTAAIAQIDLPQVPG